MLQQGQAALPESVRVKHTCLLYLLLFSCTFVILVNHDTSFLKILVFVASVQLLMHNHQLGFGTIDHNATGAKHSIEIIGDGTCTCAAGTA